MVTLEIGLGSPKSNSSLDSKFSLLGYGTSNVALHYSDILSVKKIFSLITENQYQNNKLYMHSSISALVS